MSTRLFFRSLIVITFFCCLISCDEEDASSNEPGTGKVELVFSEEIISGGRIQTGDFSVLVSIKNAEGVLVHEKKQLNLYKFGTEYISEPIALSTGNFQVTEFIVLDENNEALYASPLENSKLAHLVNDPLPLDFTISKDLTIKIVPQVIECANHSPADFGYNTFSFDLVESFPFLVGVFAYDTETKNFELTTANLTIKSAGTTLYDQQLEAETATVTVKEVASSYVLIVSKENYISFQKSFTADELKAHFESPLVVTLLQSSLAEGLIAYYPFNGNALDSTSNNHDGIVNGAVLTTDRHDNANASYLFDGIDDYISVAHDNALNLSDNFTISLWVNVAGVQVPNEGINDILRKWNGNAEGYPFAIGYLNELADDANEDKITYVRYDGQACNNGPTSYSPTIENDKFLHIVLVKEGSTLRHYLNNVLIQEFVDATSCETGNTADMTIGCRGNLVRFFKGKIDDIRIYGRTVSSDEIAQLYAE